LLLFRGGQVVEQHVGFRPREELKAILDANQGAARQEAAS
jgi:hypothetical protein